MNLASELGSPLYWEPSDIFPKPLLVTCYQPA